MKRIVTGFFLTFFAFAMNANAQVQTTTHAIQKSLPQPTMANQAQTASSAVKQSAPTPDNNDQPLSTFKTEAVNYFSDTTAGNWWVYIPVLNGPEDSMGNLLFNSTFYNQVEDSIGPQEFKYVNASNATIDTTVADTMYNRVYALRVSPPTDLGNVVKLDSLQITFFPEFVDPADNLVVEAVGIADVAFQNGSVNPIPDLFGNETSDGIIAKETIPASKMTLGQINTLSVNFSSKTLGTANERNQIAICVYVDGPNFAGDTVGYQLEADLQPSLGAALTIDTGGSANDPIFDIDGNPIPMRTYRLNLDGGNIVIGNGSSYIGGGGGFFVDFPQFDPASGQATGSSFEGNLCITTFFHGSVLAGVNESRLSGYGLGEVYPNPVSTTTEINYNLGASGPVTLEVYNVLGQNVGTLVNSVQGCGRAYRNLQCRYTSGWNVLLQAPSRRVLRDKFDGDREITRVLFV